jgi:8-hydroxy-5-deazaflavin:NADPH oxidoreductase
VLRMPVSAVRERQPIGESAGAVVGGASARSDSVAVVGASGALGFGLAVRLARAGMPVAIGSREPTRAAATLQRARQAVPGGWFSAYENAAAVHGASAVILSVPFHSQPTVLEELRGALCPGQLLIDATVPLAVSAGGRATRTLSVWQGSAAQQALEMVPPGVRVVSALHTVSAGSLGDPDHPLDQDVLLCGDSRADKREAARLIERIDGLRCVDCGPLEMARVTESLTALLIGVKSQHAVHPGIRLTGLPDALWEQ